MHRCQCKNIINNRQNGMSPLGLTVSPEKYNIGKAQDKGFKIAFINILKIDKNLWINPLMKSEKANKQKMVRNE